jgi:general stress protein 26
MEKSNARLADDLAAQAADYMSRTAIIVLSTVTEGGKPALRSLASFACEGFDVYFSTGSQTEKVKQIQLNPAVSILFQHEGQEIVKFQNVTYSGLAEQITDDNDFEKATDLLGEKNPWFKTVLKNNGPVGLCIYRVTPTRIKYLDYSKGVGPASIKEIKI